MEGTTVTISELRIGVYKRGNALGVNLFIHEIEFMRKAPEPPRLLPRDVCLHPHVNAWLTELRDSLPE